MKAWNTREQCETLFPFKGRLARGRGSTFALKRHYTRPGLNAEPRLACVVSCSSLGKLRMAVLCGVGSGKKMELALMDVKEAVTAAAPRYPKQKMPKDNAERVVEGAAHLSPLLGKRMVAAKLRKHSVFVRELMPQDLKLEIESLTIDEAMKSALPRECCWQSSRPADGRRNAKKLGRRA